MSHTHRQILTSLLVLPLLVACGDDSDKTANPSADAGANGDASSSVDAAPVRNPATHFSAAADNASVPQNGRTSGFYTAVEFASFSYWRTMDLNGDGLNDLVQTGDTAATSAVWDAQGSPYWKVFKGEK